MKNVFAKLTLTAALLAGLLSGSFAIANTINFQVDQSHSKVGFSVKHMMISTVDGYFKDFEGTFTFDPEKGTLGNTKFEVKTASIDTANAKRDEHLKNADFFDAEKHPMITVTNSKIKKVSKNKFEWTGDLNMHGVTKPVKFNLDYAGMVKDPWGNNRAGFKATTKINRKDWGLTWNKNLDGGGVVVSDEVNLNVEIEATEVKPKATTAGN